MTARLALVLASSLWWLAACGPGTESAPGPAGRAAEPAAVAGLYQVSGVTVEKAGGGRRNIEGTVSMTQEGSSYTATFELRTLYPTADGSVDADVIGTGEGVVEGNELTGTAHTQIVLATVPGVDTGFAFVPRMVSARIVSKSVGQVDEDGRITIEIENTPEEGEVYRPTWTTLHGARASDAETASEADPEADS